MRKLNVAILLFTLFFYGRAFAQSVTPFIFNTGGGSYDNPLSIYNFEWSIGELTMINTMATPDNSLMITHGVLQPNTLYPLIFTVAKNYETQFQTGEYKLFPNPSPGKFELEFLLKQNGRMEIQVVDAIGRLIQKRSFQYDGGSRSEHFDLSRFRDGSYLLVVDLIPASIHPENILEPIRHIVIRVVKIGPSISE
jgi:Secretion system C-terminal sorting domain